MTSNIDRQLFIRLSMWINELQDYIPVGTVIHDNNPSASHRIGFSGFTYDRSYIDKKYPAIDPAHLDPQKDGGKFTTKSLNGKVLDYFSEFLPGEFSQSLLVNIDQRWRHLSEGEKLYIMTIAHGDFGAAQLNPQYDQFNDPIGDLDKLNELVQAIRDFQLNGLLSPVTKELQGALCSFKGTKPKIDYVVEHEGLAQRFVTKLNTSKYYNDARVANLFTSLEMNAGLNVCKNYVVKLDCGEDVLFSKNYTRSERFNQNDDLRILYKYNRISFKTLLADDPFLNNTQRPTYKHIAHAIDKYSDDPITDKEELFRRAIMSAATNHTSNGLDNLEMYDKGMGKWRLSPSFHNLPNPMTDTQFDVSFNDSLMTGNLLRLDESFVEELGKQLNILPTKSMALAFCVTSSLINIEKNMGVHELSIQDRDTIRNCIKLNDVSLLHKKFENNENVQKIMTSTLNLFSSDSHHTTDFQTQRGPTM